MKNENMNDNGMNEHLGLDGITADKIQRDFDRMQTRFARVDCGRRRFKRATIALWLVVIACPLAISVMRYRELAESRHKTSGPTVVVEHYVHEENAYPFEAGPWAIASLQLLQYAALCAALWFSYLIWRRHSRTNANKIDLDIEAASRELDELRSGRTG